MQHARLNLYKRKGFLNGKEFISYRWMVSNTHLWNVLYQYGCKPKKSIILKFPE